MTLNCKVGDGRGNNYIVDYPCLMEWKREGGVLIVLAIAEKEGIRVIDALNETGVIETCFINFTDSSSWKPYNGSVTFSNK